MDFSKITAAVIGLGLMGGSFAMRLKELGAAVNRHQSDIIDGRGRPSAGHSGFHRYQ